VGYRPGSRRRGVFTRSAVTLEWMTFLQYKGYQIVDFAPEDELFSHFYLFFQFVRIKPGLAERTYQ
jgi:hypothetical protein